MKTPSHLKTLLQLAALALLPTAASAHQPQSGDTFQDCADCPEMVVIPAGSFTMGSPKSESERSSVEGPRHEITLTKPFAAGIYEVTFAEWDACVAAGGCGGHRPNDRGWGRGDLPVGNVSWQDAQGYVDWLSGVTGHSYRLLSESEWEYAARAGTSGRYHWGSEMSPEKANYGEKVGQPSPVGSYPPNDFGLHDVHGNMWEWVGDCWNSGYAGAPADGSVWTAGNCAGRVLRGGSWINVPRNLRSAFRLRYDVESRLSYVGFRVARDLD